MTGSATVSQGYVISTSAGEFAMLQEDKMWKVIEKEVAGQIVYEVIRPKEERKHIKGYDYSMGLFKSRDEAKEFAVKLNRRENEGNE